MSSHCYSVVIGAEMSAKHTLKLRLMLDVLFHFVAFRASQPKLSVEHQTRRDDTFEKWVRASFKILSCCSTGNK